MSLFDNIGLLDDYEEDEFEKAGLTRFLSKPIQRQWQPFDPGTGPASQSTGPIAQHDKLPTFQSHETYDPDGRWDKKFAHKPAMSFSALDEYEEADKFFTQLDGFARDHNTQASVWKKRYEDFLENELVPFGTEMGRFETYGKDFDVDSYIQGLDNDFATNQKLASSPDQDGLFSSGPSDETLMAREQSELWNPFSARNGLREKYERLRGEYEARQERADHFARERDYMQERLLSIPFEQKMELEELAASRKALKGSQKLDDTELDQMLGSYKWEAPRFDPKTGDILNINKIDPRWVSTYGGASTKSMARQTKRLSAAQKGDLEGFLNSRSMAERIRALRDKGYMMPRKEAIYPRGLSREDEDILDIARMREAGLTEYKGQSLEEAFQSMGGDERLRATKFLKNVYATRDAYQLAQQDFIRMAGGGDPDERNNARDAMNAARDHYHQALYTAGDAGLVSRLYEQATSRHERVGLLEGLGNALKRGFKSAEMSKLTKEILLNDVQESELQNFLDAAQDIEDLPGSTALQRLQEAQQANPSKGESWFDDIVYAFGLLADNPKAIPEFIVESLSAFLPAYAYTAPEVLGTTATAGMGVGGFAGLKVGLGFGARLNWGVSSLTIEYAGAIMEELRELGIDTGDPQIVMAAFNSPAIMERLKERAYKRGLGVGGVDALMALLAGRVGHLTKYNKLRGGKLVNADAWRKAKASVPRFTRWQRARGAAGEMAAGAAGGMSGELLAQLWEREEGEPLDMHAIAAEGIVDVASPMSMGGAIAQVMRNPDKMDLSTSAIEFSTPRGTNTGLTGTVTRAGMVRDWNSFERSDAAAAHLLQASGLEYDSPMGQWTQDYMARLQQLNPEKFSNIRWVLSDRTPSPDILQEGSFEYDSETGATLIYLNKEMMAKNPLRAFMHESAHFARQSMFENDEAFINTYYAALPTKEAQLDALTEYVVKTPKAKYSQLDPAGKRQVDAVWNASTELVRAEEWFAYQFARLLVGDSAHQSVAKPLKQFFESHIVPSFAGYMGAEEYAGTPEQQIRIGQAVLNAMGYTNNGSRMGDLETFFKYRSDVNRADNRTDLPTGYEGLTEQEGLNNLKNKIAAMDVLDRERAIWAVNSLMGANILDPQDTMFQTVDQQREEAKRRSDAVLEEGGIFDQATAEVDAAIAADPEYLRQEGSRDDGYGGTVPVKATEDPDIARAEKIVQTVQTKADDAGLIQDAERDRRRDIEQLVDRPKYTASQNENGSVTVTRTGGKGYNLPTPAKTYHKTVEEARAFVTAERAVVDEQDKDTLAAQERMQKLIQDPKELEKAMYLKRKEMVDSIFEEDPNIAQAFPDVIAKIEEHREANPEEYEIPGRFEATVEKYVRAVLDSQISDSEVLASIVDIEKLVDRSKLGPLVATKDLAERDSELTPSPEDIEEAYFQDEQLQTMTAEAIQQRINELTNQMDSVEGAIGVNQRNFEKVKKRPQGSLGRPLEAVPKKKGKGRGKGKARLVKIKSQPAKGVKIFYGQKAFADSIAYLRKSKNKADQQDYKNLLNRFKYWAGVAKNFQYQKDYAGNPEAQFKLTTGKGKDAKFNRQFNVGFRVRKMKKGRPKYQFGVFLTRGDIPLTGTELKKENERRTLLMDVFGEYLENAIKEELGGKDIDSALSKLRKKVDNQPSKITPEKAGQAIAKAPAFHIFKGAGPIPRFIQALIELPDMTPRKLTKLVDKFRRKKAKDEFNTESATTFNTDSWDDLGAVNEEDSKGQAFFAMIQRLASGRYDKKKKTFEPSAESNIYNFWYNTVLDAEKAHPKDPKGVRKYVLDRMSASQGQLEMQARAAKDKRVDSVRTQIKRLRDYLFLISPSNSRIKWADVPALGPYQNHWLKVETPQPLAEADEDGVQQVEKNVISWRRVTLKDLIEGTNEITAYKDSRPGKATKTKPGYINLKDKKYQTSIYRPTAFKQYLKDFDPKKLKKSEFRKDYLSFLTPDEYYMHLVAAEASWSNQGKGKITFSPTRFDADGDPKDLGYATPDEGTTLIQTLAHQILKVSEKRRKRQYDKFKKDGLLDDPEGTHPFVSYNTVQSAVPTPEEEMIASILQGRVGEAFTGAAQDYDGLRSGQRMRILLHQRRRYVESLMTDTRKEGQVKIVDGQEVWGNATAYGRMYGWGDEKGKKTRRVEININELDADSRALAIKLGGLSKEELEKRGKDVLHPWVTKKNVTEGFRFVTGKESTDARVERGGFRLPGGETQKVYSAFSPKQPPKSDEKAWEKWKSKGLPRSPSFQTNASREARFIALDGNKLVLEERVPGGIPLFKLHQRLISRLATGDMTGEMPGSVYSLLDMKKVRIAKEKAKFRGTVSEYLEEMGEEMAQKRFGYRIFGKGDTTYSQSAEPTEASAKIAPSGSFKFAAGMDVTGGKYPTDESGSTPKSQRLDPFREWQYPHRIAEAMLEYWNKEADEMEGSWAGGVGSMYVWWKSHELGNPAQWMRNKDNELMNDAFNDYWASIQESRSEEEKKAWAEKSSGQRKAAKKEARKALEKSLRGKDKKDQKGGIGDYPPALRSALVDRLEAREKERLGDFWTEEDDHIMDALRKHYVQGGYPMIFGDPFTQVHSTDQGKKATIKAFGNTRWRIRQDNPSFAIDEHDKFRDGIDAFLDRESPYIQHKDAFDESNPIKGPNGIVKDGNEGKDHNDFIRAAVDTPTNFVQMYAEMIGYGGVTGAGPQYFSSEWKGWHRDNLEASEVIINSLAREGIPPLTEVKFINEKGVQDSATWRGDRWVNTKNQRKVYRHAEYEASGPDEEVNLENDYYRIQRAWLAKEESRGNYWHNSLVSGLHMTPRRLIEQIMNYGVDMFMMAGNIDRGGKGTPGAPMGGLFPRVIFPLLKKFYLELGLLTEENGQLIPKDEEAWKALKRFDISDPNFDSLLPDVDLADVTDTDANKKVVVDAGAIGVPKNIIVDGEGMSEFLALKLQSYSKSNISGATTKNFTTDKEGNPTPDHPLYGLDKKEVVGRQKEGTTDFVYDNLALAENAQKADIIYVFRTSDSQGEWNKNQKIDQIQELALAQGKIVRQFDVDKFDPRAVAQDMAQLKDFFIKQGKTMDNVWIYSNVKPNKDREADFSNIFEALETGEFTARVKAKKGKKSKKSTGGKTAKKINIKSSTKDEWSYLSNFSGMGLGSDGTPKFFTVPGVTNVNGEFYRFFSVEQAYQVLKNKGVRENKNKLEEAYTKVLRETQGQQDWEGRAAQKAGKGIEPTTKDDYNIKLMEELIKIRVKEDGVFRTVLASTRGKELEHKVKDKVWSKEFPRILEDARKNLTRSRFDDDWMFVPASMVGNQEWLNQNLVKALGPIARAVSNAGRHDYWNEQTDHTILEQEQGEEQNIDEATAEGAEHSTKSTKKDFAGADMGDSGDSDDDGQATGEPPPQEDIKVDAPATADPTEDSPLDEAEASLDKEHKQTYEGMRASFTEQMNRATDAIFRWANNQTERARPLINHILEQEILTAEYFHHVTTHDRHGKSIDNWDDVPYPPSVDELPVDENGRLLPGWRNTFDARITKWFDEVGQVNPDGLKALRATLELLGPQWEKQGEGRMAPFTGEITSVGKGTATITSTEPGSIGTKETLGVKDSPLKLLDDLAKGDIVQMGEPVLSSETLSQYLFRLARAVQEAQRRWEGGGGMPSESERKNKPIQMYGSSMKPTRRGFLKSLALAVAAPKIPSTPPTDIAQRAAFESFKKLLALQATATKVDHAYMDALAGEEDLYHYMMGEGPEDGRLITERAPTGPGVSSYTSRRENWVDVIYGSAGERDLDLPMGPGETGYRLKDEVKVMSRRIKNMNAETLQVYIEDLERNLESLVLGDMNDQAFKELNEEIDRYNDLVMKFSKGATMSNVSAQGSLFEDKPSNKDFLQETTELELFITRRIKKELGLHDLEKKLLKTPWGMFGTAQHKRWVAAQDAIHAAQKKAGFHTREQINERLRKYVITPEIWKEFKRELPKIRNKYNLLKRGTGSGASEDIKKQLILLKRAAAQYKIVQAKENFEGYLKVDALMGAIKDLTIKFKKLKNLSMEDVEFIADFVDLLDKEIAEGQQILLEEQSQTTNEINIKPEVQREEVRIDEVSPDEGTVERPEPTDEGQQNDQLLGSSLAVNDELFVQDARFGDVLRIDMSRQQDGREEANYFILGPREGGTVYDSINTSSSASAALKADLVGVLVRQTTQDQIDRGVENGNPVAERVAEWQRRNPGHQQLLGSSIHMDFDSLEMLANGGIPRNLWGALNQEKDPDGELTLIAELFNEIHGTDKKIDPGAIKTRNLSTKEQRLLRRHWMTETFDSSYFPETFKVFGIDPGRGKSGGEVWAPWQPAAENTAIDMSGFSHFGSGARAKIETLLRESLRTSGPAFYTKVLLAMRKDYANRAKLIRRALRPATLEKLQRNVSRAFPDTGYAKRLSELKKSLNAELAYLPRVGDFIKSLHDLLLNSKSIRSTLVTLRSPKHKKSRSDVSDTFAGLAHTEYDYRNLKGTDYEIAKVADMDVTLVAGRANAKTVIHELIHVLAKAQLAVAVTKSRRDQAQMMEEEVDPFSEEWDKRVMEDMAREDTLNKRMKGYRADEILEQIQYELREAHLKLPEGDKAKIVDYGSTRNSKELLAEGLSNPAFQKYLASIKTPDYIAEAVKDLKTGWKPTNLWQAFVAAVKKLLRLKVENTLLEAVLDLGGIIIDKKNTKTFDKTTKSKKDRVDLTKRNQAIQDLVHGSRPDKKIDARDLAKVKDVYLGSSMLGNRHPVEQAGILSRLSVATDELKSWNEARKEASAMKTGRGFFDQRRLTLDYVDSDLPIKEGFERMLGIAGIDPNSVVADAMNTYDKKHIYFGKGYDSVEQARVNFREPFMEAIRDSGVDIETVGTWFQARNAPTRNIHHEKQYADMLRDLKQDKKKNAKKIKEAEERGVPNSGIDTEAAIEAVKNIENQPAFQAFMNHPNNPIQKFYDMNLEDLANRTTANLVDPTEEKRMIQAASYFDWTGKSKWKPQFPAGVNKNYAYAPMQGFEGETQTLFEREEAWSLLGSPSGSSGRGFDMPRGLLKHGAFGRSNQVGPDPKFAFPAAERAYSEGVILAHKAEVVNSFADMHDAMRRIAFGAEPENPEVRELKEFQGLDLDALHKNEEVRELMKAEYNKIFKTFVRKVPKTEYDWKDEALSVEGSSKRMRVIRKEISQEYKNDPTIVVFRRMGETHYIQFRETMAGMEMAQSLKNLRYEALPELMQIFNVSTRFISTMVTSKNPAFVVPNFARDFMQAFINLGETEETKRFRGEALKPSNIYKWGKAIYEAENTLNIDNKNPFDTREFKGKNPDQVAKDLLAEGDPIKMYMFAKSQGALVGYFRHKPIPELLKDQIKDAREGKIQDVKSTWDNFWAWTDSLNSVAENSVRISTFWASVGAGASVQQSATSSRNVTVDFNKGGNFSMHMNALYMFFRASVNATARSWDMLKKRGFKGAMELAGNIVMTSFAMNMLNRILSDEDEDDTENKYDQISHWKRDKNIVFMVPGFMRDDLDMGSENHWSLPIPLGLPAGLWAIGQTLGDMAAFAQSGGRNGVGLLEGTSRMAGAVFDMGNPFGSGNLQTMVTPTVLKGATEWASNKDFTGRDIVFEDMWGQNTPAHTRDPSRTPEFWTELSRKINEAAGGSENVKGSIRGLLGDNPAHYSEVNDVKWDIAGNHMRHALQSVFGGLFTTLEEGALLTWGAINGKAMTDGYNRIPIVSRFWSGSTYGGQTKRKFRSFREKVRILEKELDSKSDPIAKKMYQKENAKYLKYSAPARKLESMRLRTNEEIRKVKASTTLTNVQITQRVEKLEEKWLLLAARLINEMQKQGINLSV